jgi:hypothetical protein
MTTSQMMTEVIYETTMINKTPFKYIMMSFIKYWRVSLTIRFTHRKTSLYFSKQLVEYITRCTEFHSSLSFRPTCSIWTLNKQVDIQTKDSFYSVNTDSRKPYAGCTLSKCIYSITANLNADRINVNQEKAILSSRSGKTWISELVIDEGILNHSLITVSIFISQLLDIASFGSRKFVMTVWNFDCQPSGWNSDIYSSRSSKSEQNTECSGNRYRKLEDEYSDPKIMEIIYVNMAPEMCRHHDDCASCWMRKAVVTKDKWSCTSSCP